MRIGIDIRDLYIAKTGIKTVLVEIIRHLKKEPGVEIVELSPKKLNTPITKLEKIKEHILYFIWKEIQLPILVKKNKCSVLICNDYVVPLINPGCKAYPIFHGVNFWEQKENYNAIWRMYFSALAIPSAKASNGILTVSNFTKDKLITFLGFSRKKITVIPLGPKKLAAGGDKSQLSSLGLNTNDKFILHVGVFEKRKNLVSLVDGFNKIKDKSIKLVLVGQPGPKKDLDDFPNVLAKIDNLELTDRVLIPGYVTDEQLSTLYAHASLYVFPSIYEGFGIPVLEAFQNKIPVAASNISALPEVVGEAGILFDPFDLTSMSTAMNHLLTDKDLRENLVVKGLERLKIYNWQNTVSTILKTIQ